MSGFVKQTLKPETLLCQGLQVQTLKPAREPTMQDMRDAIVVLLAGGQGERLWPLTRDRAKPAVPFGALYRIIDITLSNCVNSGLRRVFVLTQYKALSLSRHVRAGWSGLAGLGEYIEILPPQMRVSKEWYQGTADAVYQNIYSIGSERSKFVFILSGDHIYKMNYAKMLQQHLDSGADVSVGTIQIPTHEAAKQFGVIEVDKDWRIVGFEEKPSQPKESPHNPGQCNASMGIYIFNTQLLIPILLADAEDPKSHHDVGTVDAYYEANMDLVSVSPIFNLYDEAWPLRTWQHQYPPAKFVFGDPDRMGIAVDSIVGGGSVISGGRVSKCVVGYNVRVNSYCDVSESILYNHVNIGRHSKIRRAIIDRHVNLPERTEIGFDLEADKRRFHVTDSGIVIVVRQESLIEEPETA